jgi:hypothetical protein
MYAASEEAVSTSQITAVLVRYCHGIDRKLWDDVRSCYHPGAVDDHGYVCGDVESLLRWVEPRHQRVAQSLHVLTNVLVEYDGPDNAFVESYCVAHQTITRREGPATVASIGCRYLDRFRCSDGAWKIDKRRVAYEWVRTALDTGAADPASVPNRSTRDAIDAFLTDHEEWKAAHAGSRER